MAINIGTAIAYLELDATRFTTGLNAVQSSLSQYQTNFSNAMTGIGGMFTAGGTALTAGLTVPIANFGKSSVQAAIDFESAFTGVKKTIDETRFKEYNVSWEDLAQGIKDIAYETGLSVEEVANVMEYAGQLGIELGDSGKSIIEFTRQMALMGQTTNLAALDSAEKIAKFMNITKTSEDEVDNLTATIVDLGNNFATTEADIANMAMRLATGASAAHFTQQEILALATALSSAGINAEAGGSSLSQVLSKLTIQVNKFGAVMNGTFSGSDSEAQGIVDYMNVIARAANVSAEEFYEAWEKKPVEAFGLLIHGMATAEERGDNMILQLDELGFKQIRQSNSLRSLAISYDNMSDAIDTANRAWDEGSAMEIEAAKRFETLEVRIKSLNERWKDVKRDIAEFLIPALEKLMDVASKLIDTWKSLSDEEKKSIVKFAEIAAAVGPVMAIFGRIMTTIGQLIPLFSMLYQWIANVGEAITLYKAGWTAMAGEASGFGKAIASIGTKLNWIIAIIALVITAIVDLWKNSQSFRDKVMAIFTQIWNFLKQLWAAVKPVFDELGALWMELARSIEPIVELLVDLLGPALEGLTAIIIPIVKIIAEILVLITKIATYAVKVLAPVIRFFVEILGGGLRVINEISSAILQLAGYGLSKLAEAIQWVVNIFTLAEDTIVGMWTQNWTVINDTLHTNTDNIVNFIQNAVNTIIALSEYSWNLFWTNAQEWWQTFSEGFSNFVDGIRSTIEIVSEWFKQTFESVVNWIVEQWESFTSWLSNAWGTLKSSIEEAWSNFIAWVTEMWNKFSQWIKDSLSAIGEHIRTSINNFHKWLEEVISKIKQTAERMLQAIFDTAQRVWNSIVEAFNVAKQKIEEGIQIVKQKFDELREAIRQKFEEIKQHVEEGMQLIREKLEQLGQAIRDKFEEIMQHIREKVQALRDKLEEVGEILRNKFTEILENIKRHFEKVLEKIKEFGQKFVDAWKNAFKNVQNGIASVFNHIRNGFLEFGRNVFGVARQVGQKFIEGLIGTGRSIKEFFSKFIQNAVEGLLSALKAFKEVGKLLMENLWNGIKSKWEDFKKLLKELWESFIQGELFSSLWDKIKSAFNSSNVKTKVNGSHADGLAYVPFNGYIAELHKGERVLTAEENQRYSSGDGTTINFYSNERIDEYTAAKELRRTIKDMELGLV